MTIHLVKLCAGAAAVEDLEGRMNRRVAINRGTARGAVHDHVTRMKPRRRDELLAGGSIYWVIKGVILVREPIVGFEPVTGGDGIERCAILLKPLLIPTEAQPRRAFQGWRYLKPEDAPADLSARRAGETPPALRAKLAELGLL